MNGFYAASHIKFCERVHHDEADRCKVPRAEVPCRRLEHYNADYFSRRTADNVRRGAPYKWPPSHVMMIVLAHVSGLEIDLRRRSYLSAHCHRKLDEKSAIKVLLVPLKLVSGGPWQGVALKPGLQSGRKTTRSSPSSTYSDQGCISASALSRMHCHRTAMVVQVRLIVGVRGVSHTRACP